jgi:hypothetical protein
MTRPLIGFLLLMAMNHSPQAFAHNRSESFSTWQLAGTTLSMRFTVAAREATRIPIDNGSASLEQLLAGYIASHVFVIEPDSACTRQQAPQPLKSRPGYLQVEARWTCDRPPGALRIDAFFDLAAEHTHFARFESHLGMGQRILTGDDPVWPLDSTGDTTNIGGSAPAGFLSYLAHGFRHITSGLDHAVFLLALLLICRRSVDLIWAITGFTLGHSITLALAVLGYVQPRFSAIEAIIGLTIALVALERTFADAKSALPAALACAVLLLLMVPLALSGTGTLETGTLAGLAVFSFFYLLTARELSGLGSYRIFITALFGMVHGFGFAGAFLTTDLGRNVVPWSLAAFNIGVELGQLALVAVMLSCGVLLRRHRRIVPPMADVASAVVCGFGVFWFVQRSFG